VWVLIYSSKIKSLVHFRGSSVVTQVHGLDSGGVAH